MNWGITNAQILKMIPKAKWASVKEVYQDEDGIWIILNDGWNADNMDSDCRTIHCGGEDEPTRATLADLKYQISGIRKVKGEG